MEMTEAWKVVSLDQFVSVENHIILCYCFPTQVYSQYKQATFFFSISLKSFSLSVYMGLEVTWKLTYFSL